MPKLTFYKPPEIQKGYIFNPQKSYFSVVIPEATTNLIYNPETQHLNDFSTTGDATIELDPDTILFGINSVHAQVDNVGTIVYDTITTLIPNTTYTFSTYILGTGTLRLAIYNEDSMTMHYIGRALTPRPDIWTRHFLTFDTPDSGVMDAMQIHFVGSNADIWINGLQLEQKQYATTFCSGNLTGLITGESPKPYFWTATPHYSPSVRLASTRDGGRLVSLETLGFHVTGFNGMGLPEFDIVSTPVANGMGSVYQGSTIESRDIEICGVLNSASVRDFFYGRAMLGHSMQPNISGTSQPLKIVYTVYEFDVQICEQLEALAVYQSGLEGDIQSLLGEEICISLTMLDPLFKKLGNNAKTLNVFKEVGPQVGPVGTDENGEWQPLLDVSELFGSNGAHGDLTIGPDNNLYIAGAANVTGPLDGTMIARWNGIGWESIGKAYNWEGDTTEGGWSIEVILAGPDGCLYVGGSFMAIGNENGVASIAEGVTTFNSAYGRMNIARYRISTNTWEYIGRMQGQSGKQNIVMDMILLRSGKIAIVGNFRNPQQSGGITEDIYSLARNIITFNPADDTMDYTVEYDIYNNQLGDTDGSIIYSIDEAPNGEIWVGGDFEFEGQLLGAGDLPITVKNVAVYKKYIDNDTGEYLGFEGSTGTLEDGNIVEGSVKKVKISNTGSVFIGGDFTADQIYDDIHVDYPPHVNVDSTSQLNGSAAFGFAKLDEVGSADGWASPFILGRIGMESGDPEQYPIVYDMAFHTDGTLHIVGQFNFANTYFPNKDYEGLTPEAGSDWSVTQALSTQTPNCNGYIIWDGTNFIQPDILFEDYFAFPDEGEPRIITDIELGALYSNRFAEHSSAVVPNTFQYQMPGTGGANVNPGFSGSIFLNPQFEHTFVSKDIIFLDLGCNDYSKPIFIINGPGTLKSIINETTGAKIFFDYTMAVGESVVLDLTQPLFGLSSNIYGNLRGILKPNSTVSSFVLNSGTIGISVNVDLLNLSEDIPDSYIKWRTQYWSIDKACGGNCEELGANND